jgi:dTDP-glucose 4,6-dehydratase
MAGLNMQPLSEDLDHVLQHTLPVWEELRHGRIFLTGGTGFFGCWLLETYAWAWARLQLDASLTVLTRSAEAFRRKAPQLAAHPGIEFLEGDIRSFRFPAGGYTHVIHAAIEASPEIKRNHPAVMLDSIVEGTRHTLEFARASHAQRVLLTSSGAVYGAQPAEISHLPETYNGGPDPSQAHSVYGEGKRMAELLCALYQQEYGLQCLIARCFAFVGPYMPLDAHYAIGNFIGNCLRGEPIEIRGDGTPIRSYLYAADLAIWLWTILARGEPCRPYNVGSERSVNIAELAATVAAVLDSRNYIRIAAAPSSGSAERYVPSTSRARTELGLGEWISLEQAISRTAASHAFSLAAAPITPTVCTSHP